VTAAQFITNEEIVLAARKQLGQGVWDYLAGASESETTLRRNRAAFDRLAFRPRVLVNVSKIDPGTEFMGHSLRIPVILAPIGSMQVFRPEGANLSAKAAEEFGTIHVLSSVAGQSLEEVMASGSGPKVFQLYVRGDMDWCKETVQRAKDAGYFSLCLTVDTAIYSRRERPMMSRWQTPSGSSRNRAQPNLQSMLTWEMALELREFAGLPLMLKGIATAEDAEIAVREGVEVIWVSNHGGRQLDHGLGSMDVLPEIVQAAGGRAKIIVDGGVQRGGDVLKALALGADVVAIGKLQGWGIAAAGKDGIVRVLQILEDEMISAMGLLGISSTGQLSPKYLCEAEPVTQPHEMSSWVNIPGTRIL
jgi:glycolate oxidase